MAAYTHSNALDQSLDVAGSYTQSGSRNRVDEPAGLGAPMGNTGTQSLTFSALVSGIQTIAGMTGGSFTVASPGNFLVISGSASNDGTWLITDYVSATSVKVANATGIAEGPTAGVTWDERKPYSLEDDINYARTDRAAIKGVTFDAAIPVYTRPTDTTDTTVPANLANIAGKTTDAQALVVNKAWRGLVLAAGNTHKELVSEGNMRHADATNRTGIPINDGADAGANEAVFVELTKSADGSEIEVQAAGPQKGWRVFGRTQAGTGVAATGSITAVAGASTNDGDTFTIDDGTINPPTIFEFDLNGGGVTPGNVAVVYTGVETAAAMAALIQTAINGVGAALKVTAAAPVVALVGLTNDNVGAQGNILLTQTGTTGLTLAGMLGGAGGFSPDSVDVKFYSVAIGADLSTSVAYTWEALNAGAVDLAYGYRKRLDNFGDTDLRVTMSQGLATDADLRQDVEDIRTTVGTVDGDTSLNGYLTNLTNYFPFVNLPDATPSVVEAFNTLNAQIGDRAYIDPGKTNVGLVPGEVITASIQKLADAIAASNVVRTIERLSITAPAGVSHLLPGGISYTLDGTDNGKNLWVYWRGVLRHPGTLASFAGNEYAETDTTHITPYSEVKNKEIFDFFALQ